MNINDLIDAVRADMAAHGVTTDDTLIADGTIHRARHIDDRKGKLSISYKIHADGNPAWYFEYWPTGVKITGSLSGERKRLSLSERRQIAEEQKQRENERRALQKQTAERAAHIWKVAKPVLSAKEHLYLQHKGVPPLGLRMSGNGRLIVPLYREDRKLVNLQFIDEDGGKRFLRHGKKKHCFSVIGNSNNIDRLLIVEGWATGASLHEELGVFVMVAMDAGNLEPVAQAARRLFPDAEIIIAGDNDESGTGQAAANKAAVSVGGKVLIPPQTGQDWNDVLTMEGAA
ncbi:toprim domain-containing protein [Methylomonas sp. SURF-2]|uniref:Toprim domain-containing protein n=1 Tax=Methylomonas subterranea TaxID=2952225 RepID=A0ABT1TJB5_9GAMM|nr:toprim domain-containing protein [Methylomonas sp. SURF-2]MCQ8105525.1 toprim domain-containing protein [Methylomonas sp. SURF-2]